MAIATIGSDAHTCCEAMLDLGIDPQEMLPILPAWALLETDEARQTLIGQIRMAVALVRGFHAKFGGELLLEQQVMPKIGAKSKLWGTSDIVLINRERGRVAILDYKFGKKPVSPKNNSQLMLYLMAAIDQLLPGVKPSSLEMMVCGIIQPTVSKKISAVRHSFEDMSEFRKRVREAVIATDKEDAVGVPGSHCFWCRGKPVCPEFRMNTARSAFDEI